MKRVPRSALTLPVLLTTSLCLDSQVIGIGSAESRVHGKCRGRQERETVRGALKSLESCRDLLPSQRGR